MQQQDFGPLDYKFWKEIFRYSWFVFLFSIAGMSLSVYWRKDLPKVEAMEASIYTNITPEIFNYFVDNSPDLKITVTRQGRNIYRLVMEGQGNLEEKFNKWTQTSMETAVQLVDKGLPARKYQYQELEKQIENGCTGRKKIRFVETKACFAMRKKSLELAQRIELEDSVIRILSFKPFDVIPASFPLRDALFGFFVGFFVSLVILAFLLQIKQFKRREL
ncbi:MAG: hypothetical protein ACXVCN_13010 [Bdellovibrio sp.]